MSIALRPADPAGDAELLAGWLAEPHVAPWWGIPADAASARAYLDAEPPHQQAWIASIDGAPFAFVETYVVARDPLAQFFDARPGDRGWHVLVGPPERIGTGAARALAAHVVATLLADPAADRVLVEPDARNARMLAFCAAAGATRVATVQLPHKTAAIFAWDRA